MFEGTVRVEWSVADEDGVPLVRANRMRGPESLCPPCAGTLRSRTLKCEDAGREKVLVKRRAHTTL